MLDGYEVIAGEQPLSGFFRLVPQPANKAGPHLVFAGNAGNFGQSTVPSAQPTSRDGVQLDRCDGIGPAFVCFVGCCVPGAQLPGGLPARVFLAAQAQDFGEK